MSTQVISFKCLLKTKNGRIISTTYNRDILSSPEDDRSGVLIGLTRELHNLKKGEKKTIQVSAEEAYGFYDPGKIILFPRKKIPPDLRVGDTISIVGKSGVQRSYTILQIFDDMVSLDGNHPLAGQDLVFDVEILDSRAATSQEIEEAMKVAPKALLQ